MPKSRSISTDNRSKKKQDLNRTQNSQTMSVQNTQISCSSAPMGSPYFSGQSRQNSVQTAVFGTAPQASDQNSMQSSVLLASLQGSVQAPQGTIIQPSTTLHSLWPKGCRKKAHTSRLMIVMRSAERVDRILGDDWTTTEMPFGRIVATDQNITSRLHKIGTNFNQDPPITQIGKYTAQLTARAMLARQLTPALIVSSPALRCMQTACAVAKVFGGKVAVEPGLFEPLSWYRNGVEVNLPEFKQNTLVKNGEPIDAAYSPIVHFSYLVSYARTETEAEGRQRIDQTLRNICQLPRTGAVLVIGHASTLHTAFMATRSSPVQDEDDDLQLTSMEDNWHTQVDDIGTEQLGVRYPPCCIVSVARVSNSPPHTLRLVPNMLPPLSYGSEFSNKPVHPVT